jgi:CBS domain-containing protein
MRLSELAAFLMDHQITGAAVRDQKQKLVGVVSATDLVMAAAESGSHVGWDRSQPGFYVHGWEGLLAAEELPRLRIEEETLRVRDVMTPTIFSVPLDAEVPEIASMMLDGHLHRLLVSDGDEVVGIISTSDLLGLLVEGRQSAAS